MAQETVLEGVFAVNKPQGLSSAQVIRDCQVHFNPSTLFRPLIQQELQARNLESHTERKKRGRGKREVRVKMGHGGTLDPLATGVLIMGVGKGTKKLSSFLGCTKTYEAVVLFGASTDTYDRVGRVLKRRSYGHITRTKVEEALGSFRGKYQQMPPLYSALKMNGKPLYEYARAGQPIPRAIETKEVDVSELEMVEWYEPGEHNFRWPIEDAGSAEQNLAEQVWRLEKQQVEGGKKLSPEEEKDDIEALAAHEAFKRKAEEKQDELVFERPATKRRKADNTPATAMMSGALGNLPASPGQRGKIGSNLVPPPVAPNTPPPWEGKGPPAAKIRMTVTSGFYVRVLCHELGEKLDSAAMMAELLRTRQGDFELRHSFDPADLEKGEKVWGPKIEQLLRQKGDPDEDPTPPSLSSPPQDEPKLDPTKIKSEDEEHGEKSVTHDTTDTKQASVKMEADSSFIETDSKENVTAIKEEEPEEAKARDDAPSEPPTEAQATLKSENPSPVNNDPILPTPKLEDDNSVQGDSEWNGFSDGPPSSGKPTPSAQS